MKKCMQCSGPAVAYGLGKLATHWPDGSVIDRAPSPDTALPAPRSDYASCSHECHSMCLGYEDCPLPLPAPRAIDEADWCDDCRGYTHRDTCPHYIAPPTTPWKRLADEMEDAIGEWQQPIGDDHGENLGLYDLMEKEDRESLIDHICGWLEHDAPKLYARTMAAQPAAERKDFTATTPAELDAAIDRIVAAPVAQAAQADGGAK